jgi:hypothetical protein
VRRSIFSLIAVVLVATGLAPLRGEAAPRASGVRIAARSAVAVGEAFVIEPPMASYVRELDQREQREQIRDWAVVGTLTRLGATPRQLATATYQTPPARLPYLDELYAFEYGRGRRAYLGNRVLLFRDSDDPDPYATIGRLADRVRRENGEISGAVEVYIVDDRREEGSIQIERDADVRRDELFSGAYGYVEGKARDPAQLAAWLAQVDDLTFAKLTGDGLVVGGRRFAGTRTANITAEDVAAIYQAHGLLEKRRADALATIKQLPRFARDQIEQYLKLADRKDAASRAKAAVSFDLGLRMVPRSQIDQVLRAVSIAADKHPSPGFSLDPEWLPDPEAPEHPLMLARLRAFAADPCGDLERTIEQAAVLRQKEPDESRRSSRTLIAEDLEHHVPSNIASLAPDVCEGLKYVVSPRVEALASNLDSATPASWGSALSLYYQFLEDLKTKLADTYIDATAGLTVAGLGFHEEDTRVQCARYEGVTGTRVGMTLFYTDLLAKLWESTDFGHSAPIIAVPGFLSSPQIDLPASFHDELKRNPYTRLWFGPRANGVSRTGRGKNPAFVFDHRFTRIFAAGSNAARPGVEVQPGEHSRRTLGWWDRHFDEIADYEQEYHRQNQIMKWALVTAALLDNPLGHALADVAVTRDLKFIDWQQSAKANLRFSESLPVVTQEIAGQECIPLLASYRFNSFGRASNYITGGVGTLGREAPEVVPALEAAKPIGMRQPYVADLGADAAGVAARARPVLGQGSTVTFKDAGRARARDASGDIAIGKQTVDYALGARPGAVAIQAGRGTSAIGRVDAEIVGKDVAVRWTDGPVEAGRLARSGSAPKVAQTAEQLAQQGRVVEAAKIYERGGAPSAGERTLDDLVHEIVVDVAHRRPAAVQAKLAKLVAEGKTLSPAAHDALIGSLRTESEAVAQHVDAAIKTGTRLDGAGGSVIVERGHVVLTRDVKVFSVASKPVEPLTDLSQGVVYRDTRLRVGQEGVLPDTGGTAARWQHVRGVRIDELEADPIGALSDRIVEKSTGVTVVRDLQKPLPSTPAGTHLYLIRQCDADHTTATTSDDC